VLPYIDDVADVRTCENLIYKQLVGLLYSVPPADRRRAYWVMSSEWRDDLIAYATGVLHDHVPPAPTELLGLPFRVDDTYGFPQLVIPDA